MYNLYFRDRRQDIRVVQSQELVDLNKQDELKRYIQRETGIQVCSPVLQIVNNETQTHDNPPTAA